MQENVCLNYDFVNADGDSMTDILSSLRCSSSKPYLTYAVLWQLVEWQRSEDDCGPFSINPKALKYLADQIGADKSDVYRAILRLTDCGLIDLKNFMAGYVMLADSALVRWGEES